MPLTLKLSVCVLYFGTATSAQHLAGWIISSTHLESKNEKLSAVERDTTQTDITVSHSYTKLISNENIAHIETFSEEIKVVLTYALL